MTLLREGLVEVMAAQVVEALSDPEKAIWRRARACSLVLAALLTAQPAELLAELGTELMALTDEALIDLATGLTVDSATELAADYAHVQLLVHSPV
jgi:hypothetical protein